MHQLNYLRCFFILCMFSLTASATNVKDFGAKGDGKTDDTQAITLAILNSADGIVEFPRGKYLISKTIDINLSNNGPIGLSGKGASASVIMLGEGPAFRFIGSHDKGSALPSTIKPITWEKERMPLIDALEIIGGHKNADGIELRNTMQATLRGVLIRNTRTGVHLTSRNRNVIIDACHVYNSSGVGIYLDKVNIHQMIISDSHISYCKAGGIKVSESEIRNFQITGNDIEYNCDPTGAVSADIWIDCSKTGTVREGTISGNTIQAIYSPGGANIRFTGFSGNPNKIGLWSITGNHIGNQDINIHLDHSRGVNVTGNTFMRGYDRHLIIDHSKNIIVGDNVFDHNPDYFKNEPILGGISIDHGENIILSDNIIEGSEYGNKENGGAIVINNSRDVTVSGSQIRNAKINGLSIANSVNVRVTNCLINEDANNLRMIAGIALSGICTGTVIKDNSVSKGKNGYIINNAKGTKVSSNIKIKPTSSTN
jgi:hypothetical protein